MKRERKRKADTSFEILGGHESSTRPVTHRLHLDTVSIGTSKGVKRTTKVVKGEIVLNNDPPSNPRTLNFNPDLFDFSANDDFQLEQEVEMGQPRARTAADDPMHEWMTHDREVFLDELLRCDGRGSGTTVSCRCEGKFPAEFRCIDCLQGEMKCKACVVSCHAELPLHRIQAWNGRFFEKKSLKSLGLRIQLNHSDGDMCGAPRTAPNDDFVIVDTYQVHEVGLNFCNCEKSIPFAVQLLRARLYPTTGSNPRSAVTFSCLKHFHLLSLESKCSVFEYMASVARGTDNTGTDSTRDRYDEFLRVIRQWRHLKMLKRSGRGHDPDGLAATKPGECAILCPACPHPGKNLPTDWRSVPEGKKYLYSLFIALDANFRLKRKKVSSEDRDPSLGPGWAFFVEESSYKEFVTAHWGSKQPRSTCVSHDAVNKPDREANGLAASGAGTVDCSRHDLKRPCGVGDLQLGERYINMDYIFFSSIHGSELESLVVSYDIVCQWHLNLRTRMMQYPHRLHISSSILHVTFLIPKFHLPAHIEECNLLYSFNLTKGVARTDGEAPERGWANINPLAESTKEMGPGNRRDTIDDFFNDWNWKKIIKFGPSMVKKVQEAARSSREHADALKELEGAIPKDVIDGWTAAVESWETNPEKTNPYQTTVKGKVYNPYSELSERAVRLKLAEQVAREAAEMGDVEMSRDMHASTIIGEGLALEEEQHKILLEREGLGDHPTTTQLYKLTERSNQLRRKITLWIDTQVTVMPEAARHRSTKLQTTAEGTSGVPVYDIELLLPSKLAMRKIMVDSKLRLYEWQLRYGQAHDALDEIRNGLRLQAYLYKHKDRYASGVKANTRSNNAISKATEMVKEAARKYRAAREALLALAQSGLEIPVDWGSNIRPLRDEDCRKLSEGLVGDTEGRRTISWIWMHYPSAAEQAEDPRLNDALRIEWCRSRARAMRWAEEVELLQEEMRRIRQFLRWEEDRWMNRACERSHMDMTVNEGVAAYAFSQGNLRRKLREHFEHMWREVPHMLQFFGQPCVIGTV